MDAKVSSLEEATKENTERITSLEKATRENTQRIISLEKVTKENTQSINNLAEKIENNKQGIMDTFDRMDKSISKRFDDMENYMHINFDKLFEMSAKNNLEHTEIKQILGILGANHTNVAKRIEKLEEWKKGIDGSLFAV